MLILFIIIVFYYDSPNPVFHNMNKKTPVTGLFPVGLGNFCKKNLKNCFSSLWDVCLILFSGVLILKFQAIVEVSFVLLI